MSEATMYAAIAGVIIASVGLWWFRLVLPAVRKMKKTQRYGVYTLVWLAYFILTLIVVGKTGDDAGDTVQSMNSQTSFTQGLYNGW